MSSITSATAMPKQFSPLSMLQSELASEVSSGAISSDDQAALSAALKDIDAAMKSQAKSGGSPPSPDEMQSKINELIANEVSEGNLTAEQAEELKNVFANAFQGGPGGPGGPGGAGGGGGASEASSDPADTNGDGVVTAAEQAAYDAKNPTSSDASGGSSDVTKLLQDFLKQLQETQSSSSTYGSDGDNLLAQIKSLIVDYQA